jgi:hypothetical protein
VYCKKREGELRDPEFKFLTMASSHKSIINVLALIEEADFEALNCLPALNLIRSTKLHLTTEPAFLPNACYQLAFVVNL